MSARYWMSLRWNEAAGKYRMYCHLHDQWWQDCPCWGDGAVDYELTPEVRKSVTPEAGAYVKALEATLGEVRSLPETEG